MFTMKRPSRWIFIGLFVLTACSSTSAPPTATVVAPPQEDETKVLPTPSSPNDSITWEDLQVTMDELDITQEYVTEYGSTRLPPAGHEFLWVHVRLKNQAQIEIEVPAEEHFSVLYAGAELKPTYGHRQGYTDYTTLGPMISPGQEMEGWIRFDIPTAANVGELLFVFIPESAQIGTSYSSPNYPYAANKPTYVWKLEP